MNKKNIVGLRSSAYIISIIHLYIGFSALLEMLYYECGIEWYYDLFWNNATQNYIYPNYMKLSLRYTLHPILYLPITIFIIIVLLFTSWTLINKKEKYRYLWMFLNLLVILLTLVITVGLIYGYWFEMSSEVV